MRHLAIFTLAALLIATATGPASAVTDEQIQQGIEKLVNGLYNQQNNRGTWDPDAPGNDHATGGQYGGTTALVTYALLTAGESYQSPKLRRALEFLNDVDMEGVYARACRAHVWSHLPPQFNDKLREDLYWLLEAQHKEKGHYNYTIKAGPNYDNSVTQYGVLGVWEAAKRGHPVGTGYWSLVEKHFVTTQHDNGGWDYRASGNHGGDVRGSMVAAGLAVLYITQDYLHAQDYRTPGRARKHPLQDRINKALDWFGNNFDPNKSPGGGQHHYYLYGVERIGLASGVKYFNKHDWYEAGAEVILKNIPDGAANRAFSLLFLVRGRVPVFINKLEIPDYDWNNRPRDLGNLTAWVSDEVEKRMNWQVIPIDVKPEQWLEAPMLYLASHKELQLTEEQEQKIKRYIDLGGMLVTTADGNNSAFTHSVKELMKRLYPQYNYERISPDDELMNVVFKLGTNRLQAESMHNGVRHIAIHLPRDVSWTLHSAGHADPFPWQFFANAYYYATEKGRMRNRMDTHYVERQNSGGGPAMTIGRAQYEGNWNPEPLAWEIQSNFMYNAKKADVKTQTFPLDKLPDPSEAKLVHIAGTGQVEFSEAETNSIKQYVDKGGTLFFENVGGRGAFAESAINMLAKAFPDKRVRPISLQDRLITGTGIGGYDVSNVDYRSYALLRMGKIDAPRLLSINIDDKPRIIISGEDLTEAMLDQPVWGVFGYNTESAQKLMTNIVLSANK